MIGGWLMGRAVFGFVGWDGEGEPEGAPEPFGAAGEALPPAAAPGAAGRGPAVREARDARLPAGAAAM